MLGMKSELIYVWYILTLTTTSHAFCHLSLFERIIVYVVYMWGIVHAELSQCCKIIAYVSSL